MSKFLNTSSPSDQYDSPFVAFHVVSFFVGRPDHFGTVLKVPIHVNSLKKKEYSAASSL